MGTKKKPIIKKEYFIKWAGFGPEHCTWEPEAHLANAPECIRDYWKSKEQEKEAAAKRPRQVVTRRSLATAENHKRAKV